MNRQHLACAVTVVGLSFGSGLAGATTKTWVLDGGTTMPALTAWYSSTAGGALQSGTKYGYSGGVGVLSGTETSSSYPDHALDNKDRFESLLLSFGSSPVSLNQVTIGWHDQDSDFFLLAYTGAGTPDLSTRSYTDLGSNGWTLVGSYAGAGNKDYAVSTSIYSSFWLIGAGGFSSGVGVTNDSTTSSACVKRDWRGTCTKWSATTVSSFDYIKIASVSGVIQTSTPPAAVPEPESLALAGLGLLGLVATRRRWKPA